MPSVLWRCWLGGRKGILPVKNWVVGCSMVICLERGAGLHVAQLMPLPLTVSCFSKIQIGFTFLVPAHPGSPGKRAIKRVCVCCCIYCVSISWFDLGREERIINAMLTTGVFVKDAHCSKDSTTVSRTNHPRPGRIKKCRRRKSVYNCSPTCSSSSSYTHFPSCKCTWHQGLHIRSSCCCLDIRKDI